MQAAVVRLAASLDIAVLAHDETTRDMAKRIGAKVARFEVGAGEDGASVGATEDCIHLDYNPTYGGASIALTKKGHTGEWRPFGCARMSPADFCTAVSMMQDALRFAAERSTVAPL